jgi:hypothetical protein
MAIGSALDHGMYRRHSHAIAPRQCGQRLLFAAATTPKHGSWLNIAEIELSVLSRQCLERRLPDVATLQAEVHAWQEHRDRTATTVDWRFTTADARITLKRLYPSIQEEQTTSESLVTH